MTGGQHTSPQQEQVQEMDGCGQVGGRVAQDQWCLVGRIGPFLCGHSQF